MSTPDSSNSRTNGSVKTLAIRLEPDLHAQLSLIAQLRGSTITDEIRHALDAHLASVKADPNLAGRADTVLAAIERDAAARRDAIATLFGASTTIRPVDSTGPSSRSRGSKTTGANPEVTTG